MNPKEKKKKRNFFETFQKSRATRLKNLDSRIQLPELVKISKILISKSGGTDSKNWIPSLASPSPRISNPLNIFTDETGSSPFKPRLVAL